MQLQQVCFQANKSFVLLFNLVHYLVTHTALKNIFVWSLGKKFLCHPDKKLTNFDKVVLFLPLTQSVSKPYTYKKNR